MLRIALRMTDIYLAFGSFYSRHVEALTGSTKDARDPDAVARTCYAAAVVYAIFVAFCGLQVRPQIGGLISISSIGL